MHNKIVEKALTCLAVELPEEVYDEAIPLIRNEIINLEKVISDMWLCKKCRSKNAKIFNKYDCF